MTPDQERAMLQELLAALRTAESRRKAMRTTGVAWDIYYHACLSLNEWIARRIHFMGGMAGGW